MKGVIRICIFGVLLTLAGCRSESLVEEEELYREQIDKIKFFENYEKDKNHRYDEEWLNYENTNNPAIPFSQSLKTLLVNRPEVAEIIKKHYGEIYWEATSRVIESKEGDKVVYYPIIGKGKDRNKYVLKSIVNKNHTYLRFEIQTKDKEELASQVLDNFAAYLSDNEVMESKCVDRNGIPTCDIDYVEIIRWKDRYVIKTPLPAFGYLPPANPPYYWDVGEGRYVGVECMNIGGCGESLPLPIPPMGNNSDPCDKTKDQIVNNDKVKGYIEKVKTHANKRTGTEIGYRFHKDGSVTDAPKINNHRLEVGDPSVLYGFYHNHTSSGVDVFSPQDIASLIEIERYQSVGNKSNAFFGKIAYGDIHYVIRWGNDETNSLPPWGTFTQEKLAQMANEQIQDYYASYSRDKPKLTREERLEKVFYQTLDRMGYGIKNHIVLQKIDKYGNVSTVKQNADGTTTSTPCN